MPTSPATTENSSSNGSPQAPPAILLELVDEHGNTIGTAEKLAAHQAPGQLHRAFSVFLFDEHGRLLLQRRALGKYHSPGVWSNTCCGHPYPGEAPFAAAARRTHEELGISPSLLAEAPTQLPPEVPDGDLWARVAALPPRQRDAVVLRFVGDLDHRAVAAALGTSPGMSRRLVSDAIATLRLDLKDQP